MKKINLFYFLLFFCFTLSICACTSIDSNGSSSSEDNYYNVKINSVENGTVVADKSKGKKGEVITVVITPNDGFIVSKVILSYGQTSQELDFIQNKATFTMPESDVLVDVEFYAETRESVDYLILGDSYTDYDLWANFYSDMKDLPAVKTVGVGGTKVPHWGKTGTTFANETAIPGGMDKQVPRWDGVIIETNILDNYYVKNFVFHVGVNDIRAGVSGDIVISDLKTLFEQYHEEYPNANIYWVSLSLNVSDLHCTDTFKMVNNAIKEYANECDYLTYINTVDTMFPDGQPHGDWFVDGLHFNADGYATWSSLITEALGYSRKDVDVFGSADIYYSSNSWNYDSNTQTITNETLGNYSEESLWFDGVFAKDMYAEMEICVNKVENNDQWPKVGLSVMGRENHAFFFIETTNNLTGKVINYTERRALKRNNNNHETSEWDWTIQGDNWTEVPSLNYTNGNFAKLGLLRCGADMYFFINDELVFTKGGFAGCDDNMAIGLTLIDLNVTIKNYSVTTNVDEVLQQYDIQTAPKALFETVFSSNFTNTNQNGTIIQKVANFSESRFYFETEITLDGVLNIPGETKEDEYPKAGIYLQSGSNALMFYIDAINTGSFGTNKYVGIVHDSNGAGWNWQECSLIEVPSLSYTNSSYAKLAVYKDAERMVFMVNDIPVLETSKYNDLAGETSVGIIECNLSFKARNTKIATSNTILDVINERIGFEYEVEIDGDLSDWPMQAKTNYYGKTASDASGRSFKVYSFMGKSAVYVGYEITSTTFVDNTSDWWLSTNAEMHAKNNSDAHIYVSANGQSNNVLCYSIKTTQDQTTGLYTTYIEIAISYCVLGVTPEDASVNIMFAARPGSEVGAGMCLGTDNVWWCGDHHPSGDVIPFNITFDGINFNVM